VLLLLAASTAAANTRSQQLYARALIPFHAQRWEEARRILDEAAAADPNDAVVAYYRGLTYARLGSNDKAIKDIEHALSLRPDLQPAVLDLGILYFETGQYPQAEEWLQRAYKQPANRFAAAFFLGLTKLRTGDSKAAQPLFAEAAKDPQLRQSALYYQGVAAMRSGDTRAGQSLFAQVQQGPGDTETAQIARQYITAAPPTLATTGPGKRWSVYADGGFGYDSNVTLTPNSSFLTNNYTTLNDGTPLALDTHGEMDGFVALAFGGQFQLFSVDMGQGSIGYDFYQSVHFTTPSFDLQNHHVHLDLSTTKRGPLQMGVSGFYDFYMLDYQSFYNQGRGVPWVNFFEGQVGVTQIYYQIIGQDYSRGPFSPFRDAINNAFGARQFFLLGAADRYMSFGYQFDDNDPLSKDGTDFAYSDNIFDIRGDFGILDWAHLTVGYAFDLQDYEHRNSRTNFSVRRHDGNNQVVARLTRDFLPYLTGEIAWFGIFNTSNIPDFEYNRNIVEASVKYTF
jgi:Tfp pilus assembly protein PilF